MLAGLARSCFRHPWRVFAAWAVALVAIFGVVSSMGAGFDSQIEIPDSETKDGFDILEEHFEDFGTGFGGSIVFVAPQGVTDPEVASTMTRLLGEVEEIEGVTVRSPYEPGGERQISQEDGVAGTIAYADVELDPELDQVESADIGKEIGRLVEDSGVEDDLGVRVELGGTALAEFEPPETEALGLAFAVVLLVFATGSVLAMGTTVGVALIGVVGGVGLISLVSQFMPVPDFATTIGLMIGLGVGIDYALFIVTRYRESIRSGHEPIDAIAIAMDTSGRSVLFAGVTVVVSLLGLTLIGLGFISGLGVAAASMVLIVMGATITLLPSAIGLVHERAETSRWRGVVAALLVSVALLGVGTGISPLLVGLPLAVVTVIIGSVPFTGNVLRRQLPARVDKPLRETMWYRLSRSVQARPWTFAVGGTAVLLLMAVPVLDLRLGFSDEGNFGEESTTRQAYDLLAEGFGPGANGRLLVATEIDGTDQLSELQALSDAMSVDEGVAVVTPPIPSQDGEAAIIMVQPTTSPQAAETEQLVKRLRSEVIPGAVGAGELEPKLSGAVAANIEFADYLSTRMLVFFAAVLGLSFLLLMVVFRSLLVPLKAVIMNMLSIGAAYGVVVAIFQWGWLGSLFGIEPAPIEPFIPMMLFAVVFGLSMDYEVFLLSRVKEEYERTGDPVNSVADGLAATARVITTAAAIMVVVFGSFVFESDRVVKLFGLGLAMAVLLDASLVRMLIVPSTMELLGARNWWLPRWLDRILPNLNVEGTMHDVEPGPEPEQHEPDEHEPALSSQI